MTWIVRWTMKSGGECWGRYASQVVAEAVANWLRGRGYAPVVERES